MPRPVAPARGRAPASRVAEARTGRRTPAAASARAPRDRFEASKPRADGSLVLGRRAEGPGEVVLGKSGQLSVSGRSGPAAAIEAAHLIEAGAAPFEHATAGQLSKLVDQLSRGLDAGEGRKPKLSTLLGQSAAATLLLEVARTATGPTRTAALTAYLDLLRTQTRLDFKASLLLNLEAAKVKLTRAQSTEVDAAWELVRPSRPPYDAWVKNTTRPTLEVRQYVMDDFWKSELASNKARGFKVVSESAKRVVLEQVLHDPKGRQPDLPVHLVMVNSYENVFQDLDDPRVDFIVYSGHAQLGGVADASVRIGPSQMKGDKLVALFNCRSKMSVADFKDKYPRAHLSATFASSFATDDAQVLDQLYAMIARRDDYASVRKGLVAGVMDQPPSNYLLPDDLRQVGFHDDDEDGRLDQTPLRVDRFFDPAKRPARKGEISFRPAPISEDPESIPGAKVTHAVGYANTAFYYFSEENPAAPLSHARADTFVPAGWFTGDAREPVRFVETRRDGKTYLEISVNSKFAGKSRDVITALVLYETQLYFAKKQGHVDADDKLRGLLLVGSYADLYMQYSDEMDQLLGGFARQYGFTGPVDYDVLWEAGRKDGEDDTASLAAVAYLKKRGVGVGSA